MRSSNLIVQIRGQLLAYLANGSLEAGGRLPAERELAARLGVSRPSVREAIKTLEAEAASRCAMARVCSWLVPPQ